MLRVNLNIILTFIFGFIARSALDSVSFMKYGINMYLDESKLQKRTLWEPDIHSPKAVVDNECDCPESDHLLNPIQYFYDTAKSQPPATDKVILHEYQLMYGRFLVPYYNQNPNMKMLEIGLGCDMAYGPGVSVSLHRTLFPQAELWEAEFDEECLHLHRSKLKDINVLAGDQGDKTVLDRWIKESRGNFDVIIDDGGHKNCQIWNSLQMLWPELKSGGLYFLEDLHVGKYVGYESDGRSCEKNLTISEEMKDIVDLLIYKGEEVLLDSVMKRNFHPDVEFIFCQLEACVIGKK